MSFGRRQFVTKRPPDPKAGHIYGIHPVLEALEGSCGEIKRIIVQSRIENPRVREITQLAEQKGIEVVYDEPNRDPKRVWPPLSQGVLAEVKPFVYADISSLPEASGPLDAILLLDGVTDPRNLGALLRVADAVSTRGVVIPKNRSSAISPVVVRAASGAVSHLKVCRVANLRETLRELKSMGYWIVGLDEKSRRNIFEFQCPKKVVLVAGSEGSGIRRLVREECDWIVSIPMWGKVQSLNVSVAVAVALYALAASRQSGNVTLPIAERQAKE